MKTKTKETVLSSCCIYTGNLPLKLSNREFNTFQKLYQYKDYFKISWNNSAIIPETSITFIEWKFLSCRFWKNIWSWQKSESYRTASGKILNIDSLVNVFFHNSLEELLWHSLISVKLKVFSFSNNLKWAPPKMYSSETVQKNVF